MSAHTKYSYKLRPTYGLGEMLIEFFELDQDVLINDLIKLFSNKGFDIGETEEVWMVDEVWTTVNSKTGKFTIIKDTYGFVFLMASDTFEVIYEVDEILEKNDHFEKEEVNFDDYKLDKKQPGIEDEGSVDSAD